MLSAGRPAPVRGKADGRPVAPVLPVTVGFMAAPVSAWTDDAVGDVTKRVAEEERVLNGQLPASSAGRDVRASATPE